MILLLLILLVVSEAVNLQNEFEEGNEVMRPLFRASDEAVLNRRKRSPFRIGLENDYQTRFKRAAFGDDTETQGVSGAVEAVNLRAKREAFRRRVAKEEGAGGNSTVSETSRRGRRSAFRKTETENQNKDD